MREFCHGDFDGLLQQQITFDAWFIARKINGKVLMLLLLLTVNFQRQPHG
jgi:hypothetical protein